jgi:hypothetical protein
MTTTGHVTVQISLAVILMIVIAYTAGRVHQWYRHSLERDLAYREGYNQASQTLFPLAVRKPSRKLDAIPVPQPVEAGAAAPPHGVVPHHMVDQHHSTSDWPQRHSEGHDTGTQKGRPRS